MKYKKIGVVTSDSSWTPEYIGITSTALYLCPGCGNVVGDKKVHDEFHEKLVSFERNLIRMGIL